MIKQINKRRQSLSLAIIAVLITLGASGLVFAQKDVGKKYNARDPQPCSKAASPNAKPTTAEAVASVICNSEHESGIETLFLVEDVAVAQIGKGTPFNPITYPNMSDIDVDFLIYPIRGSLKRYQCTFPSEMTTAKSCLLYDEQDASGRCFKNAFGQWVCSMSDLTAKDSTKAFPPGSTEAANKAAANTAPAPAQNDNQPVETKNDNQPIAPKVTPATPEKDENGFVKPDFSEMEKYFEIVKTNHDFSLGRYNLLVKMKKQTNICDWVINYYDADGVKVVQEWSFTGQYCSPEMGEPTRIYAYMPSEKQWRDEVVKIVVTRKVH